MTGINIGERVVRNYVLSFVRVLVGFGLSTVVLVVLTSRLAPAEFALYSIVALAVAGIFNLVTTPITTVLIREPIQEQVLRSITTFVLIVMAAIAVPAAAVVLLYHGSPVLALGIALYLPVSALAYPSIVLLVDELRTGAHGFLDLIKHATLQVVLLVLVMAGAAVEPALGIAALVAAFVFLISARRLATWKLRLAGPAAALRVARQAWQPFSAMALVMFIDLFSVPVVAVLATTHESGLYGWAMSIVGVPASLIFIALQVLQPAFARVDGSYAAAVLAQSIRVVRSLSAIVVTPVVVAVPLLVYLAFPHVWLSALPALMIMLSALVLQGATYAVVQFENARGSLHRISRWQRIAFAASIPALMVGAVLFGATGAACAYLLGRILLAFPLHRAAREHGVRYLLPQAVLTLGIVGVAAGTGFATTVPLDGTLELAMATLVSAFVVIALLWVQNHATAPEDARFIWGMLRRQKQAS